MEEEGSRLQENLPSTSEEVGRRTRVGFPQAPEKKQGRGKIIFVILAVLALVAVGAWLVFGNGGEEETASNESTPTTSITRSSPTPTQVEVNRKDIKLQILNGTGITAAAGDLRDKLTKLGYSEFTVGNASNQDYKNAEVTFTPDVAEEVKEEITDELKDLYQDVDVKSGSVGDFDIRIATGYPKGYTATPSVKPTVKPTGTVTPSPKPTTGATTTVTPTATTTVTPTP